MIDKEIIEKKIDIITENMGYLHETKEIELDAFISNFEKIQATKHCLQEAIEACLDIANHIIASKGFPRAEEYGQFFSILADKKIIRKDLANRLADMAKFRNLLVHRYSMIEPKELHRILNENLADIEGYVRGIMDYVSKD